MADVKYQDKIYFPEGHIYILWSVNDEETGYDIEITGEDGIDGNLVGIDSWSFGEEFWSKEVWGKWGDFVTENFKKIEGNEEKAGELIEYLGKIHCYYDLEDDNHLRDLDKIIELVGIKNLKMLRNKK